MFCWGSLSSSIHLRDILRRITQPKHHCRPIMSMSPPLHQHTINTTQEWLEEHETELKALTQPPTFLRITLQMSIHGMQCYHGWTADVMVLGSAGHPQRSSVSVLTSQSSLLARKGPNQTILDRWF